MYVRWVAKVSINQDISAVYSPLEGGKLTGSINVLICCASVNDLLDPFLLLTPAEARKEFNCETSGERATVRVLIAVVSVAL